MRRHPRYPVFATAVIRYKDDMSAEPIETLAAIANISEWGLGIYSYTPIEKGKAVSIDITFLSHENVEQHDRVEGKVAWSYQRDALHILGISFDEALSLDRQPFLYDHFWNVVKGD